VSPLARETVLKRTIDLSSEIACSMLDIDINYTNSSDSTGSFCYDVSNQTDMFYVRY